MENNEVDKHEDLRNALEEITHKALAMESVNLDKLYTALSKAQAEMEVAKKDSTNPFFKSSYSDLTSIVSASRPSLTKNGLAIIQRVKTNNDNKMYLLTRLCHSSGQWIESNMIINPPKLRLLPASTSGYARINVNNTYAPLDFQMNGDTKMQLLTNGFLGIGTINPTNPLSVRSGYISTGERTLVTLKFDGAYQYGNTVLKVDLPEYGYGMQLTSPTTTGVDNGAVSFYQQTSFVGSITLNTSSTSYNTTSDYRLKENREEILDAIERVKELKPAKFNWIREPKGKKVDGFYAHELKEVVPEAVTGEKDELDYEDKPKYQSVDQSKVVPLLTAALQQAINKIEELELRINKLGL